MTAVPVEASVVLSTMYLDIHWGVDLLAGATMAVATVSLASRRWRAPTRQADSDGHRRAVSKGSA